MVWQCVSIYIYIYVCIYVSIKYWTLTCDIVKTGEMKFSWEKLKADDGVDNDDEDHKQSDMK